MYTAIREVTASANVQVMLGLQEDVAEMLGFRCDSLEFNVSRHWVVMNTR